MADEVRLIDIIDEFISGDWGEEYATEDAPCAVSCVRGADIVPISNSRFENIPVRYISASSLKNRGLSEGNIIIEKSGGSPTQSTGRTVYVSKKLVEAKKNIVCSNFCQAFRIKEGWNPLYVYYYLQVVYNSGVFFNFEGKTSGLKNLILDSAFQSITIKKVPLEEQDRVANMLSLIDDKIAANHAINDYLEAMARQLYDYWFVQFDFPDKNGKPFKSSGGEMVWNEKLKREIPVGWKDGQLIDISSITMGQSPDGSSYNETGDGILFYQGSTDFGIRFPSVRQYTNSPTRFAKKGDILMSVRAPVGAVNIANNDCCIGRGLAALNSKIGSLTHLYFIIRDLKTAFDNKNAVGTTFGSITKDELYSLPVVIPSTNVIERFENMCSPVFERQMIIGKEIDDLISQREELLPLLMNGQVSVKQLNNHLSELDGLILRNVVGFATQGIFQNCLYKVICSKV